MVRVNLDHFWAKTVTDGTGAEVPGISVRDHCVNVGCVAEALMELAPKCVRDLLPQGTSTLAALHDIGKISPGFQAKCAAWLTEHCLGEMAARERWRTNAESDHAKVSQHF